MSGNRWLADPVQGVANRIGNSEHVEVLSARKRLNFGFRGTSQGRKSIAAPNNRNTGAGSHLKDLTRGKALLLVAATMAWAKHFTGDFA